MEHVQETARPGVNGHQRMTQETPKPSAAPSADSDWKKELVAILLSKPALGTAAVLVALVAARLGVNWLSHRKMTTALPTVKVAQPSMATIDKTLRLPGDIEAIEQAKLYAHVGGYLKKIFVDEGDTVEKGELLATIDAPDIVQEYNRDKADAKLKDETRERYKQLLAGKVVSQEEYDTIDADAQEAEARLQNAQANMDYTQIRAPFSGSIARRFLYPGDLISAATKSEDEPPIFELVNEQTVRISIMVPQNEVANIGLGHPVDITVDAYPDEVFHGAISRIDALLDEDTKTQRVLIDIKNPEHKLRVGMFANVALHTQHADNAMTVPLDAVLGGSSSPYVMVVENGVARKRPVRTGLSDQTKVQIVSGLSATDSVIVTNGSSIADGASVNAVAGPAGQEASR